MIRAIALLVVAATPAASFALTAQDCEQRVYSADFEIEVQSVRDLGQGIVMETSTGQGAWSGSQQIVFDHCASGQRIVTVASSWNEYGASVSPVNPYTVVRGALEAATVYTMADVARGMREQGVDAELATTTFQTCGCAVFYPQARGTRAPWGGQ